MKITNRMLILPTLFISLFGLSACEDDEFNETNIPMIYEEVESMKAQLDGKTSCNDIYMTFLSMSDYDPLKRACKEYNESKSEAGNVLYLATEPDNAGFYMATYIYLDGWHNSLVKCTASGDVTVNMVEKAYEDIFSAADCTTILDDAKTVTKKYNPGMALR